MRLPSSRPTAMPADMLPILNVVLLLLAFFVMLARLPAPADASLPRSEAATVADVTLPLLQLDADGRLRADGQVISEADVGAWLRQAGATQVRLQARADAAASQVLAIVTLLRTAGAQRVQLLVAHPP